MRCFWIALFVAGGCIAAPAPLAAQEPTTADTTYHTLTPMLEYVVIPYLTSPLRGASIRLSAVRGDLEAPTLSAGVFMGESGRVWLGNIGIGANMMVAGPLYAGAEAGLLFPSSFHPVPTAYARIGARFGDVGPMAEIRAGLVVIPSLTVALGFRF